MPIFEFKCPKCGRVMERILIWGKWPPLECPTCGELMEKVASAPAVHFKGEGWTKKGPS